MRSLALILLLFAGCATADLSGPPRAEHVVIVSIDGLRPDFYLDGAYDAPSLKEMVLRGGCARAVEGVFPSVTYPSHASIVTGVRPWKHGIYANTTWNERGPTRDWHWYARDLKAPPLWQAARAKGLKVAITYWPTSVGAQADWLLGEIWDPDSKDTFRRLVASASPPGLLPELALAVGVPQERIVENKAAIDNFVSLSAAYVFRKYRPNLQLVHLLDVDDAQHKHGSRAEAVRDAVRKQDANLERIRDAIRQSGVADKTVLMVVGDHGFTDVARNVNPNALLRDAGLLHSVDGAVRSWRALARSSGGSVALYVKDPADIPGVTALFRRAAMWNGRRLYTVIERPRLDSLGYNPEAALALDPAEGWAFSGALTREFVEGLPTVKGNHGQLPTRPGLQTGFVAEGPSIRAGAAVAKMRLIDVAPTAAALLGFEMPDAEGVVVRELLR